MDGLLAASGLDLAIEMCMPVRACGVLWAQSEYVAPQRGWKGTLVECNITDPSYSPDPPSGGPTSLREGAICACRRPLEGIQIVPKAPSEPTMALGHRTDPPDPLGAVSGPLRAPERRLHVHAPNRGCGGKTSTRSSRAQNICACAGEFVECYACAGGLKHCYTGFRIWA